MRCWASTLKLQQCTATLQSGPDNLTIIQLKASTAKDKECHVQNKIFNNQAECNQKFIKNEREQLRANGIVEKMQAAYDKDMEALHAQQKTILAKMKKTLSIFKRIEEDQYKDQNELRGLWKDECQLENALDMEKDDSDQSK